MINEIEIDLLQRDNLWHVSDMYPPLDVFEKYGTKCAVTDLAVLTGCDIESLLYYRVPDDKSLRGRTGKVCTKTPSYYYIKSIYSQYVSGDVVPCDIRCRDSAIRPVLKIPSKLFEKIVSKKNYGYKGIIEVEFGEYPQWVVNKKLQSILEKEFASGNLNTTGKNYTFDSVEKNNFTTPFSPIVYPEYEYNGKKYIRFKNLDKEKLFFELSNEKEYNSGDYVWLEVSPIIWFVSKKDNLLISKRGLVASIKFDDEYEDEFEDTEIYKYMTEYLLPEMLQNVNLFDYFEIKDNDFSFLENIINELSPEDRRAYMDALEEIKDNIGIQANKKSR